MIVNSAYWLILPFFQNQLFRKIVSEIPLECQEIPLECQTIWIQIRPDLGQDCLHRYSADHTIRQRVKAMLP